MRTTIELKWFPPSWVQISARDRIIYVDPAYLKTHFIRHPKKVEFSSWPDEIDGLPEKGMAKGDVILITHHHKDHCKRVTVNRLSRKTTLVVATRMCGKELGDRIKVVQPGMRFSVGEINIRTVAAYNVACAGRDRTMHKQGNGVGYLITLGAKTIYHAGDTDLVPEMDEVGPIDLALLPIGGRGFTMDAAEAVEAARRLSPTIVIPIHRFDADPHSYKRAVEKAVNVQVALPDIGEPFPL